MECVHCGSLYCNPMPDGQALASMYGTDYKDSFALEPPKDNAEESQRLMDLLKKLERGTFVDYGCGGGTLLTMATKLNWKAIGIEYDQDAAEEIEKQTGARVVTHHQIEHSKMSADVLHLGDVIEHLTDVNEQMPQILRLIKPGGLLVAQGPLEANPNFFTLMVRAARSIRRGRRIEMAPYHVMLATSKGQRMLFTRLGLSELEFEVTEVPWPAPPKLSAADLLRPRLLGLFMLRKLSQVISTFFPEQLGNRYLYIGRRS